jgi:hypothetical protein
MSKTLLISLPLMVIAAGLIHELGHSLTARVFFKKHLRFKFWIGDYGIPRYVWGMPFMEKWKQRVVAAAGFTTEIASAVLVNVLCGWRSWYALLFLGVALTHLAAYPMYTKGSAFSDFHWFK